VKCHITYYVTDQRAYGGSKWQGLETHLPEARMYSNKAKRTA